MKKVLLCMFFLTPFIVGCAKVVFPYEEEKLCTKASKHVGYCGSLSDVYEDTLKNPWRYK